MKRNIRICLPVIWALLLLLTASLPPAEATDPSVTLGRWINYGPGTFNFPAGQRITAVAVDNQERLWIGTAGGGIAAFDGAFWTRYTTADGLVNDNVLAVAPIGKGVLLGTQSGVSLFDAATNTWTTYTGGLPSTTIHAIAFGRPLVTWIFATPAGLAECSPIFPAGLSCAVRTTGNSDLAGNWVWDVAVGEDGTRWIVTDGGVNRVAGNTWTTYTNANTPGCGVIESARRVVIDDTRGRVWFGTDRSGIDSLPGQGVCMFDTASGAWRRFHSGNSGLTDDTVKDLAVDGVGRAWFGTVAGGVSVCAWVDDTCYWQAYRTADGLSVGVHDNAVAHVDPLGRIGVTGL
jgi:ligand-binding sensor domain-containing protein